MLRKAFFVWMVCLCLASTSLADELENGWIISGTSKWTKVDNAFCQVKQSQYKGTGRAICKDLHGGPGTWRGMVEPGPGVRSAGIVFLADQNGKGGMECIIGGTGESRGFLLRDSSGQELWSDPYAPWECYEPYLLEAVVAKERVRVQMLRWDGELISQSDWVSIDEGLSGTRGYFGLMTEQGVARFWNGEIAEKPMVDMTPNAPNRLRLSTGPGSSWRINGGLWKWTDAERKWIRQSSHVERSWAILQNRPDQWTCRVKIAPPAGGAGMVFNAERNGQQGLLCWLGGQPGTGSLNLYLLQEPNQFKLLWSSEGDKWRYDRTYVLQGETKNKQVRIGLLAEDGSLISQSPWINVPQKYTQTGGVIGFHTWRGPAEFGHFGEVASPEVPQRPSSQLHENWRVLRGKWRWGDDEQKQLVYCGSRSGQVINKQLEGIRGNWSCTAEIGKNAAACLLFQVSDNGEIGFAGELKAQDDKLTCQLINLANGKTLWEGEVLPFASKSTYLLHAQTTLDRVRFRLQTTDGTTLADSGYIYVSSKHNDRTGYLGIAGEGAVTFGKWSFESE
jgi:hypothetical protein